MSRAEDVGAQITRYFKFSERHTDLQIAEGGNPVVGEYEATAVRLFGPNDLTNGSVSCFVWYRGN